ncbi:DMT family transporter [Brevibacillus dissolubilis]|uniref:DMT family transporter n=1 Tax=Brevibacillus dissolubilis TaxID=1844116 RepID=UPI0011176B2B|nr:EamA family transporter [Brevibacillus dissolubilis]
MKSTGAGAICLSLAASIWGGMYVVSKYVMDYVPPITLMWLRYAVAFCVLYALVKLAQRKTATSVHIEKKDWWMFAWIGFIGYFVSICLQFIGTKWSDAHTGALITSATPAFIVIFARYILSEAWDARKIISLLLATIGVGIVVGWDSEMGASFWGSLLLVGAAVTWALLSVYVKVASARHSSLTITTYAILFAWGFTTPTMIWELMTTDSPVHLQDSLILLGILYMGIVATAGAFFLWNKGMELMDAGIGSLFFFFQPLVGSVLGWLLLSEQLDSQFFIGGALIVAGVLLVTVGRKKQDSPVEQPQSEDTSFVDIHKPSNPAS